MTTHLPSFFDPLLSKQVCHGITILRGLGFRGEKRYEEEPRNEVEAFTAMKSDIDRIHNQNKLTEDLVRDLCSDAAKIPPNRASGTEHFCKYIKTVSDFDTLSMSLRTFMNLSMTLSFLNDVIKEKKFNDKGRLDSLIPEMPEYFAKTKAIIEEIFAKARDLAGDGHAHFMRVIRTVIKDWIKPDSELGKAIGLNEGLPS